MTEPTQMEAEEARYQLPELLAAAERGRATIITRRGRSVAAIVPVDEYNSDRRQQSLLTLRGSGHGLWDKSSMRTLHHLRKEWNR